MLESQTSSSSAASFQSARNENLKDSSVFPEKFRDNSLLSRKVFFDEESFVYVMITSRCELIECKNMEIVNYVNLQSHFSGEEVDVVKPEEVEFEFMISDGSVVYALKVNSKLFGIERKASQLKVLKVFEKVSSIRCAVEENYGEISMLVTFQDQKEQLTSFLEEDHEEFNRKRDTPRFHSIYECVAQKIEAAQNQLNNLQKETEEMNLKLQPEVPSTMLQDVSFEFPFPLHT